MTVAQIPTCFIPPYQVFFKKFIPTELYTVPSLKILLGLAKNIDADMSWVARL